jgi:hypothetical protein
MRRISIWHLALLFGLTWQAANASDHIYEGQWHTTNRKLDGTMKCIVTDLGNQQWLGRFVGVWQGVPFDHAVRFSGPPDHLQGTATIDGADYTWTGEITGDSQASFKGKFGGTRYTGYFDLKEHAATAATQARSASEGPGR